jgi:hypothetical protein
VTEGRAVGGAGVVGAAWASRGLAALCAAAGFYAASVSLAHIVRGAAIGTWLLPLSAGVLTFLLSVCVVCEGADTAIAWRVLGGRVAAMALLAAYAFVLLPLFGFLIASVALVLAVTLLFAPRRGFVGVGGLVIAVGMWALFSYVLAEPLPGGLWGR